MSQPKQTSAVSYGISLEQILNKGPKHVRYIDGEEFMLSCRHDKFGLAIGIAAFGLGKKCPKRSKHMMIPAYAREDYFAKLQLVEAQ